MKLLDKQSITTLKNIDRKREVEEGAKLAKKIDILRETASKEEANLSKFRDQSLRLIKEEIDKLIDEKLTLRQQIEKLKEEKQLLINL